MPVLILNTGKQPIVAGARASAALKDAPAKSGRPPNLYEQKSRKIPNAPILGKKASNSTSYIINPSGMTAAR